MVPENHSDENRCNRIAKDSSEGISMLIPSIFSEPSNLHMPRIDGAKSTALTRSDLVPIRYSSSPKSCISIGMREDGS